MYGKASFETSSSASAASRSRARGPQSADAAQPRRLVLEHRRAVPGQVAGHPRDVVAADRAARDDEEVVLGQARDREVAHDPAARRAHRGVDDRADRAVHVVGGELLQERERARPVHLHLGERREVEHPHAPAARAVLGRHDRRPLRRGPGVAGQHLAGIEARVGLEPLRPLPARALEEHRAEVALGGPERRAPERAQLLVLLARMQRVVDLAVLLRPARPGVRAARARARRSAAGRTRACPCGRRRGRAARRAPCRRRRRGSPRSPRTATARVPRRPRRSAACRRA